jgi:hypothetical protein
MSKESKLVLWTVATITAGILVLFLWTFAGEFSK